MRIVRSFLIKTEPGEYAFDDLLRDGRTSWTGVTNAAALQAMGAMRAGDEAFLYHTGAQRSIVGLVRIVTDPFPDPDADDPRRVAVDIEPLRAAAHPVTLSRIKADPRFEAFALVRQSRLSVMEVPASLADALRDMAGLASARVVSSARRHDGAPRR